MNCKCTQELKSRMSDKIKDSEPGQLCPKNATFVDGSVRCKNEVLSFEHGIKLVIPFSFKVRTNSGKTKEIETSVMASHCPFCGVSLQEEKPEPLNPLEAQIAEELEESDR